MMIQTSDTLKLLNLDPLRAVLALLVVISHVPGLSASVELPSYRTHSILCSTNFKDLSCLLLSDDYRICVLSRLASGYGHSV